MLCLQLADGIWPSFIKRITYLLTYLNVKDRKSFSRKSKFSILKVKVSCMFCQASVQLAESSSRLRRTTHLLTELVRLCSAVPVCKYTGFISSLNSPDLNLGECCSDAFNVYQNLIRRPSETASYQRVEPIRPGYYWPSSATVAHSTACMYRYPFTRQTFSAKTVGP